MENGELYGKAFYACFVNGDEREEQYPFSFLNEYELVETGAVEAFLGGRDDFYRTGKNDGGRFAGKEVFDRLYGEYQKAGLKGERFIHDKLELTGNLQMYYATVYIEGMREAGKLGEYGKWYRLEFGKEGAYSCKVREYSAEPEEMFAEESYRCNIEAVTKEENGGLNELFKVYPDGEHIFYADAKMQERKGGFGTLPIGAPVDSIVVWHCTRNIYLCVEFYDANQLPVGLFDMAYQGFVYAYYSDQNMTEDNWGNRVPITVIISHWHKDHVDGLVTMAESYSRGSTRTYDYFFKNMDLHVPNTFQPPDFNLVVKAVRDARGNVTIFTDRFPMAAPAPAFDFGLAQFNHPVTGEYSSHPHLHGMYVRCQTVGGRNVLMVGDTVYRGIQNIGAGLNQPPHQGDLAAAYDVLIACHHGGDYHVSIAKNNYVPGIKPEDYIPIPGTNPVVIYSANGNGITGSHPHPTAIGEYRNKGWTADVITNANYSTYGKIPAHIQIHSGSDMVKIT